MVKNYLDYLYKKQIHLCHFLDDITIYMEISMGFMYNVLVRNIGFVQGIHFK